MKKIVYDYGLLVGLGAFIIALDQWTKWLVRTYIAIGDVWAPAHWILPYARIVHWKNTGAAFGIFQGYGLVFTILAVVVSVAIFYYFPRVPRTEWYLRLAMGLQLGGALGNLVDRLVRGEVTDFISVGNFAVFNVADSSITVGVVILLAGVFYNDLIVRKKAGLPAGAEPAASQPEQHPENQ